MDFGEMFTRLSDLVGDAALVAGDDMQVSSRVVTVIRLNHVVEQILFRLTGELDVRGIATKNGDGSTARLLQQAGMAPAVAHRGGTSLANMVLLCRRHHRYIHHKGWTVTIGVDGHPWFIAPNDPTKTELRSHARRTMTSDLAAA